MRVDIGNIRVRFDFSISRIVSVNGINSNVDTENREHILLWDFDHISYSLIIKGLKFVQDKYHLSTIHIITSSLFCYHAYCFTTVPKAEAMYIINETPYVDNVFFKLGVVRGYWTLRFTPKQHSKPPFVHIADLLSDIPENTTVLKNLEIVSYKTGA